MIDKVLIESDEDGFHLILDGDLGEQVENYLSGRVDTRLNLTLSSTAALELRQQVREQIEEWAATHDEVKADFDRYKRTGEVPPYVSEDRPANGVPPTPGREEEDAHASPSDPWRGEHEAEGRAVEQYQEDKHAERERLLDRADYERKRDRESR